MTKLLKILSCVVLFGAMTIESVPCGTGGTPRRPTPSPKNDPKTGGGSRPTTPIKK